MIYFFLIISFILHIVMLLAIYFLFNQMKDLKKNDIDEMNQLFEEYLEEIKEENEWLQSKLTMNATKLNTEVNHYQEYHHALHKEPQENIEKNETINHAFKLESDDDNQLETSLEAKVLHLHHQGHSVENIAKQLKCGKTEAKLIINLHHKRNS